MKLLHISLKIWIFLSGIVIFSATFLWWILMFKIEMQISVVIKVSDYGTKILISPEHINYFLTIKKIIIKINQQFLHAQIRDIKFNPQHNFHEIEVTNLPPLMPNSAISAQIIYDHIRVIDYILTPSV